MKEVEFLEQIEARLEENRRLLVGSLVPVRLRPIAAYLGFHTFRMLWVGSLVATLLLYGFLFEWLMGVSKILFGVG